MQREDERPKGRHPLLTKQDGIELFHAYGLACLA
jgi:hypothetical protein